MPDPDDVNEIGHFEPLAPELRSAADLLAQYYAKRGETNGIVMIEFVKHNAHTPAAELEVQANFIREK